LNVTYTIKGAHINSFSNYKLGTHNNHDVMMFTLYRVPTYLL